MYRLPLHPEIPEPIETPRSKQFVTNYSVLLRHSDLTQGVSMPSRMGTLVSISWWQDGRSLALYLESSISPHNFKSRIPNANQAVGGQQAVVQAQEPTIYSPLPRQADMIFIY
jgi:hypothetical protein